MTLYSLKYKFNFMWYDYKAWFSYIGKVPGQWRFCYFLTVPDIPDSGRQWETSNASCNIWDGREITNSRWSGIFPIYIIVSNFTTASPQTTRSLWRNKNVALNVVMPSWDPFILFSICSCSVYWIPRLLTCSISVVRNTQHLTVL